MEKVRVYGIQEVMLDGKSRENPVLIGEIDGLVCSQESNTQLTALFEAKFGGLDEFATQYRRMILAW